MADAVWAVPSRPFVRHLIESGAVVSSFCVRQFTTYNSRLTPEVWWPTVHTLIFSVHVKLSPSHRIDIVETVGTMLASFCHARDNERGAFGGRKESKRKEKIENISVKGKKTSKRRQL